MRILLTGANGQVGWETARRAAERGYDVVALDSAQLDITHADQVWHTVRASGAQAVINAAAYTAVDRAEQEQAQAYAVNRDGAGYLAAACDAARIPLLHLSTDYVFDGRKREPYREDDPVAPLGVYGASKWQGEQAVRRALQRHIILRVSWVFGSHGHNFVKTILRLAREREQLRVVVDQCGCPTFAGSIAEALLEMAHAAAFSSDSFWGTYHFRGAPVTTWYGFASEIVELGRRYEPVKVAGVFPITTAEYPTAAARPGNSVLACQRIEQQFGLVPQSWREALEHVVETIITRSGE